MKIRKEYQSSLPEGSILNTSSDSPTNTYSCDYINKYGKVLWTGNFTSGSITVPNISNYGAIAVVVGGVLCYGNKSYGIGGFVGYGSYDITQRAYRFSVVGDTVSINEYDKGGSDGTSQVPITAIYGLF